MPKNNVIHHVDPYEIPPHFIPPGMIYQWVAKKSFGRIDPQYQAMLEAGWVEVPYKRLETHYLGRYRGDGTEVSVGGQVLMERAREQSVVARDKEVDKALHNAQSSRNVVVHIGQHVRLSYAELDNAMLSGVSSAQYAAARILKIANGVDDSLITGRDGSLIFMERPRIRVAKYRWLNWLFNSISKETTEYSYD